MTGPQGWRPPDDNWDRPLIGVRTAWLVGFGLVIGGLAAAAIGLVALLGGDSSAGAGWLGFGVATLGGGIAALIGLAFLLGALQATIRLRRDRS